MLNEAIQLKIEDNGVAVITIDIPDSKVNTLSTKSMTALSDALDILNAKTDLKGLVIASGKKDNFIAGADVKEIQSIQSQSAIKAYQAAELGKEVFAKIEKLSCPTVAAINGICLGGGTELALSCKYRIASPNAKIGLPEVKLGFIPGWGACVRLPKLVGFTNALDMIMATRTLDAKRAWKIGLVCELVDGNNLLTRSIEIALRKNPKTKINHHKKCFYHYCWIKTQLAGKLLQALLIKQ
jgi:3-hydroxyacyl-CoA dehydrogenase/enoyl-CoA hydratase/3-hydroxybutyryl-CoA epimerase